MIIPRSDVVYRVYRQREQNSVPRLICETPVADAKTKTFFWRMQDKNRMPVPLFFAGAPATRDGKFDFDRQHKGLSVSYLATPYDWGVALSSADALILIRARLLRQHDWVAVDLHVYNVYGPPLDAPPVPWSAWWAASNSLICRSNKRTKSFLAT